MQNNGPDALSPSVPDGAVSGEERAGEIIKRERERRQISIDAVAKALKLNARYIEAIESNKYDQLPGDTYLRVYLRSLSRFFSLDSDEIFRRFFKERGLTGADTLRKDSSTKINLKAQEEKKSNTSIVAIFSVLALLAVFSFFVNLQGRHPSPAAKINRAVADTIALQKDTALSLPKPVAAAQAFAPDTVRTAKRVEIKLTEKHVADTVVRPAAGTVKSTIAIPVPDVKKRAPADTAGKAKSSSADTAKKAIASSAASVKKDTVKPAGRTSDTPVANRKVSDSVVKTRTQTDTGSMTLKMTVVGDSCWGRVISDGVKDWKNVLHNGKGASFAARDSFYVHVASGDAVAFTFNGKPLEFTKKKGVVAFKVDPSGAVTFLTLEKWNSIVEKRQ